MSVNWSTNESSVRLAGICCEGEVVFILDLLSGLRERATSLPGSCGEVVFISSLFQDCVRGQHLCLAHAERSSSHPKTNKYWGFVWLFLALNTNCNRLYSWKLEKNLLRPFCTHFTYPQSRILSPFDLTTVLRSCWPIEWHRRSFIASGPGAADECQFWTNYKRT